MPLSEDEQRILGEIERRFYENDPDLAREVSETTLYSHAARLIRVSTLLVIVGLVVMITQFSSNEIVGFAGFATVFVGVYFIWVNLRKIGRAGWQEFMVALRTGSLGDSMRASRDEARHRIHRRRRNR